MAWDIGIDLGSEFARMAELDAGPTLSAPTAMAMREGRTSPICAGELAERLEGRTCRGVRIVRPLSDGVLANNLYAANLMRWLYEQADRVNTRRRFGLLLTCAPFARPVQREALQDASLRTNGSA